MRAAVAAVESLGAAVEFGPFGSTCQAPAAAMPDIVAAVVREAFANGATHVSTARLGHRRAGRASAPMSRPRRLLDAIKPVLDAVGATLVRPDERQSSDIPLVWEGVVVAAVRTPPLHGALDRLIESVESDLGGRLGELPREDKQRAVRLLHERGAFVLRKAVDDIADRDAASAGSPSTTTSTRSS